MIKTYNWQNSTFVHFLSLESNGTFSGHLCPVRFEESGTFFTPWKYASSIILPTFYAEKLQASRKIEIVQWTSIDPLLRFTTC